MVDFQCQVDYYDNHYAFDSLDDLSLWLFRVNLRDVTIWFGECPVSYISDNLVSSSHLDALLFAAYTLATKHRGLLPAYLGVRTGSYRGIHSMLPRIDYLIKVGSEGKEAVAQHSILDFLMPACVEMGVGIMWDGGHRKDAYRFYLE